MSIAETIFAQMGGNRFVAMTGARDFVADVDSLTFRLRRNAKGINCVRVTLQPSDTYRMEFVRVGKQDLKVVVMHDDIYSDQLCACFEAETGLYTSL